MSESIMSDNELLEMLMSYSSLQRKGMFFVPLTAFRLPYKILPWEFIRSEGLIAERIGIDVGHIIYYTQNNICFYRSSDDITYKFTLEIPYAQRDMYFDFIIKFNNLIPRDGYCTIFYSNIPYNLKIYLVAETSENFDELNTIIQDSKLVNTTDKDVEEFLLEMSDRKWDSFALPSNNDERIRIFFETAFAFTTDSVLKEQGYNLDINHVRKKLFISYTHKDAQIVNDVVVAMSSAGTNTWYDKQEIDYGDNLLEKISTGLRECDLHLFFISNNTLTANFAKHELNAIMNQIINHRAKWFIVRLDAVNPNDIYMGLGGYRYFDFHSSSVDELVVEVTRMLKKI